ncbi:MAG: transporter [Vicinamibacteria bacterium]
MSGIAACTPPTVLAAEGAHQVVEGRAIDNADNSATLEAVVNIDKTNPTVSLLSAVPKAKANGWNDTDVILTFECKDNVAGSGIARCPAPYTVDTEGPTQVFQGEGTDVADNIALSAPLTLNIDKTKTWNQVIGGKTYEIHPMAPTYDGDSGIFHLPTAYVLPRRAFSTGVFRDHVDRDPNALDISVLEISFGFGITDALEVFGAIGENRVRVGQASVRTSVPEFPGAASGWHTGVGDLRLGGKYALRNEYKGAPMSLALRTVVNFGNADAKDGLGAGEASLISDVAMSKNLGTTASVHGAIGYQTGRANGFRFGAGINAPAHRRLQLQAEFTGLERHDRKAAPSYVDLVVGPVLWFKPGWFVRAAFETNLNRGGRSTRNFSDFQIGVGYHFGLPWRVVKVAPPGVRIIR